MAFDAEQPMNEAAVPDVKARRFDQALFGVGAPWGQTPDKKQVDQDVEIMTDGLAVDLEVGPQFRAVDRFALAVGQHGPKSPQAARRNPKAQLGHVAFQIRADQGLQPAHGQVVVIRQVAIEETAPEPQLEASIFSSPTSRRFRPLMSR